MIRWAKVEPRLVVTCHLLYTHPPHIPFPRYFRLLRYFPLQEYCISFLPFWSLYYSTSPSFHLYISFYLFSFLSFYFYSFIFSPLLPPFHVLFPLIFFIFSLISSSDFFLFLFLFFFLFLLLFSLTLFWLCCDFSFITSKQPVLRSQNFPLLWALLNLLKRRSRL